MAGLPVWLCRVVYIVSDMLHIQFSWLQYLTLSDHQKLLARESAKSYFIILPFSPGFTHFLFSFHPLWVAWIFFTTHHCIERIFIGLCMSFQLLDAPIKLKCNTMRGRRIAGKHHSLTGTNTHIRPCSKLQAKTWISYSAINDSCVCVRLCVASNFPIILLHSLHWTGKEATLLKKLYTWYC